jgi:hypothetical protein
MSTTKYAVQASLLTPAIHVGRANKAGTAFVDKAEMTDDVLLAVAAYVEGHFNGRLRAGYKGDDHDLSIQVSVTRTPHAEESR